MENTNKYAKSVPTKKWKDVNVKIMKGFMAVVFDMGLIKKNLLIIGPTAKSNTPWFCMFSRDHFRKTLGAFHIVDNSIIPEGMIPCID